MTTREKIFVGLAFAGFCGCMRYMIIPKILGEGEVASRNYVVPRSFKRGIADLDNDGQKETVANYLGKNYLFRLGTNGVPYLQPIKGLENEVGR